jgi:hypothetical protein
MNKTKMKEVLINIERLPFSHKYWIKEFKGDVSYKHTAFSQRYNSNKNLKEVFYKFIVRL